MAKDFAELNRLEDEAGIQAPEAGRKTELVNKFVKAWENETARRAVKGGTGMTMALTLAACGGSSSGGGIPFISTSGDADDSGEETPIANLFAMVADGITDVTGEDPVIEVPNPTAGADPLATTIDGDGTGTLELRFEDADDTVTLDGASDLSGYDTLAITAGTVDVTGVDLSGISSITVSSGVTLMAAQFLALEDGVTSGSGDSEVTIIVGTPEEAADVIAAIGSIAGTSVINLAAAPGAQLTANELTVLNGELDAAVTQIAAEKAVGAELVGLIDAVRTAEGALKTAVDAQADFLKTTFSNDLVKDEVVDGPDGGTDVDGNDVTEQDLLDAHLAAADAVSGDNGAAFLDSSDAVQDLVLESGKLALETDVADAKNALPDPTVAGLTKARIDAAEVAEKAYVDAQADLDEAGDAALQSGNLLATAAAGPSGTAEAFAIEANTGDVTLGTKTLFTIENSSYTVADGVTASSLGVDAAFFSDLQSKLQALNTADKAVDTAETNLATAIENVASSQDVTITATAGVNYDDNGILEFGDAAIDDYVAAEAALVDFNAAVDAFTAVDALVDQYNELGEAIDTAEAGLADAIKAIEDPVNPPEGEGSGLELDYVGTAPDYVDGASEAAGLYSTMMNPNTLMDFTTVLADDSLAAFGTGGLDQVHFGSGYTFVELDADAELSEPLGSASALEIFAQETGANVTLFVEKSAVAGSNTTAGATESETFSVVLEDVALADLTLNSADGLVSAGELLVTPTPV